MRKRITFKKKKAQQLIEFLLIAPFFVALLTIIIEYAYAINIDMTLNNGLKTAVTEVSQTLDSESTNAEIQEKVRIELSDYLYNHIVENDIISFNTINNDNTTVFVAVLKYRPIFKLSTPYFNIIPEEFNFVASTSMPKALTQGVSYTNKTYQNEIINAIWTKSDGIMEKTQNDSVSMLFLIPVSNPFLSNAYTIVSWNGTIYKNGTDYILMSLDDKMLYNCNTLQCTPTGVSALSFIGSSFKNITFINDAALSLELSNIDSAINNFWVTPIGTSSKLSNSNVDGILKRAIAIASMNKTGALTSLGNHDNIKIDSAKDNQYKVKTKDDYVFVYTGTEENFVTSIVGY